MKKKIIFSFSGLIIYILILVFLKVFYVIDDKSFFSSVIGVFINAFNFGAAIFLFLQSDGKSDKRFIIFNFGGLVVRILIVLAIIFSCLKFLNIDTSAFIFHFLIFYFLLQIMEITIFAEKKQR